MTRDEALALLTSVAMGALAPEDAAERLATAPFETLLDPETGRAFATVDQHRELRQGWPEVIYGEGKSPEQVVLLAERIGAGGGGVLVTRAADATRIAMAERFPQAAVNAIARTVRVAARAATATSVGGVVCVVTAGTTDLPVADECAETVLACGLAVERVTDVGVAGVHRVLARTDTLRRADVLVVIAGMDGALPSVVGGLVARPVIAVPTSVGYGAAFGGVAALLAMLNSCASGVVVVNIDNGFGAGMAAARILARRSGGTVGRSG